MNEKKSASAALFVKYSNCEHFQADIDKNCDTFLHTGRDIKLNCFNDIK